MEKRIIYQGKNLCVIIPSPPNEYEPEESIEDLAKRITPTGVKYKIINVSDFPSSREFRNAWEYDFSKDSDGVGA
jgi:hypothetical protein